MRKLAVTLYGIAHGSLVKEPVSQPAPGESISIDAEPWITTITPSYSANRHADTCKVFTHLHAASDAQLLTKGHGGFDSHQRGLHVGWRHTEVAGNVLDTWHMTDCSQRHTGWLAEPGVIPAHSLAVDWCDKDGNVFLKETRAFICRQGRYGTRMLDFQCRLAALHHPVSLRGDAHHAGVQLRLANEVCRHPWTTQFILPAGARRQGNDVIAEALWACCVATVRNKRHAIIHMVHPANPGLDDMTYGVRAYGLFGARFDADIKPGFPIRVRFRILWSEGEMTTEECETFYREYTSSI